MFKFVSGLGAGALWVACMLILYPDLDQIIDSSREVYNGVRPRSQV